MINFKAYDIVEPKYETYTFADPDNKRLYSNEIEDKNYYAFLTKYNPTTKVNEYYIVLSDKIVPNMSCHIVSTRKDKVVRIDLSPIWKNSSLNNIEKCTHINITKVEESESAIIYLLDI